MCYTETVMKTKRKSFKPRGRRRIQTGLSEHKTLTLYREGRRLLAKLDCDEISVAQVCKAAGISVGAFYVRFKDKDTFLDFVCVHTFGQARRRFEAVEEEISRAKRPGQRLADHLISEFANGEFAGVVRVAVKLGFSDPLHRRALDAFRENVAARFVEATEPKTDKDTDSARNFAVQAATGVLVDTVTSYKSAQPANWTLLRPVLVQMLDQSTTGETAKVKPIPEDQTVSAKPSKI